MDTTVDNLLTFPSELAAPNASSFQLSVPPPEAAAARGKRRQRQRCFVVLLPLLPIGGSTLCRLRRPRPEFGVEGAEELLHNFVLVLEAESAQEGIRDAGHAHGQAAPHQHRAQGELKIRNLP